MKGQLLEYLFKKSPVALSYHKVIIDKDGFPYDCEFLDVNNIYENMMGIKDDDVINKRFNEIFQGDDVIANVWRKAFQEAIINNITVVIDVYNKAVQRWIRITIFILDNYSKKYSKMLYFSQFKERD